MDGEDRGEDDDLDGNELIPSPDSGKSTDNEGLPSPIKIRAGVNESDHEDCDDVMDLENTARSGIIHALSNVSFNIFHGVASFTIANQLMTNVFQQDSSLQCNVDSSSHRTGESMITMTNGSLSAQE